MLSEHKSQSDISIILPAYNEAKTITNTLETIVDQMSEIGWEYELIVVNDGSDDSTKQKVEKARNENSQIKLISYPDNRGKGYAVSRGVQASQYRTVLFIDSDFEIKIDTLPEFIETLQTSEANVVVGSKRHPDSDIEYPLFRRILSVLYKYLVGALFGLSVSDTQVGMKIFSREAADDLFQSIDCNRYAFDLEILVLAQERGYVVEEAPIVLDFGGDSSVDWQAVVKIIRETVKMSLKYHRWNFAGSITSSRSKHE